MSQSEYVRLSLELHLFFDRIMKEHSLFLEESFQEKDGEFKKTANEFQRMFSNILENAIVLADGNVSEDFLRSNEIVTNNTISAETKTSNLTGTFIDTSLTRRELNLRSGQISLNDRIITNISALNKQTLLSVQNLIRFKNDVLNHVLNCRMYTTNYPLLISHIMNEAKMYHTLLTRVENRQVFTSEYIYEQEMFWNNIMMEHAEFIRGLLDPSEKELMTTANNFANNYQMILNSYGNNKASLTELSLNETINFRNFKIAGEEGILNCKIKSIIIPLLADHVLREANHFIRILRTATSSQRDYY